MDDLQVVKGIAHLFVGFCPEAYRFDLFQDFFGFFGIIPEFRLLGYFFLFFDQCFFPVDVKGTSSRLQASYTML